MKGINGSDTEILFSLSKFFELMKSRTKGFQLLNWVEMTDPKLKDLYNELFRIYHLLGIPDEDDSDLFEFKDEIRRLCCEIHIDNPLYCSLNRYNQQYDSNLEDYLSRYNDSSELDFIEEEVKSLGIILIGDYQCELYGMDLYPDVYQRANYARSAKRKLEFLAYKAEDTIKKRDLLYQSFIQNHEDETSIDYSGNKIGVRIALMYSLGILDYLMGIYPFNAGANKLAEGLSSFMGVEQTTIQSYINPIYSKGVDQSKSALTKKNKAKAVQMLIAMGVDIDDLKVK